MAGNLITIKEMSFSFPARSRSPQSDKGTLSTPEKLQTNHPFSPE
jgi:hypothetical protein